MHFELVADRFPIELPAADRNGKSLALMENYSDRADLSRLVSGREIGISKASALTVYDQMLTRAEKYPVL